MSIDDCYCCICHIFNKKLKPINVIMLAFKIKRLFDKRLLHSHTVTSVSLSAQTDWIGALEIICLVCFSHS